MPPLFRSGGKLRRIIWLALAAAVAASGAMFVFLGVFLDAEDPLRPADAIFVLGGTRLERQLEAADLYLEGMAKTIVLTEELLDGGQTALRERGIPFQTGAQLARDVLIRLGVPASAIVIPPLAHDSTAHEARTLRGLALHYRWRRVIVVTSRLHTLRAGYAVRRELKGMDESVEVVMRGSRYDPDDPARFWNRRGGLWFAISESQKLVLYWLGFGS